LAAEMNVSDNSAVLRRFEASPGFFGLGPKWSARRSYLYVYGFLALLVVPILLIGLSSRGSHHRGKRGSSPIGAMAHRFEHLIPAVLVLAAVSIIAYYLLHNRKKVVISVTGDGLTVNQRPGEVYSFADARLGLWGYNDSTMGTALHLRCGARDFVLGGRDHRIGAGTRIDEPPVPGVDAWLWAEDFGELLSMAGPRTAVDFRPPVPGDPTRCLLLGNPLLVNTAGPFSFFKQRRIMRSATRAQLALDLTADEIRVTDPHSNTLITSAPLARVTATPAEWHYRNPWWAANPWSTDPLRAATDFAINRRLTTTTELILSLPDMEDLGIACRDAAGNSETNQRRFVWRGQVRQCKKPAAYAVSGADWLLLVEKLDLVGQLKST
jgi:hypothetical protein